LIYSLKRTTGGRLVVAGTTRELELRDVSSDAEEFRLAAERNDWSTAERLYQGPLLEGLFLSRSSEFNDWLDGQRGHFAQMACEIVEGLRLDGRYTQAAGLAARIGGGIGVTDRGLHPTPIRGTAEDLPLEDSHSSVGSAAVDRVRVPFVGRHDDLAQLEQFFTTSTSVGFTAVAVEGEPGIGKSALADRFARLRALRGSRVLIARAFLAEQNVPFGVVAQWVKELGREQLSALGDPWNEILAEAFPGIIADHSWQGRSGTSGSEFRILEALRRLFLSVIDNQPLLLILDDAHLADQASLAFVHYFARRSAAAPMLFIATVRVPSLLGTEPFVDWPDVYHVKLAPLPIRDTASLMSRLIDSSAQPSTEEVANLSRRTGGNPLLLVSLLATNATRTHTVIPDSVMNFFVPRLGALSVDAALLLAAVAIAGDRVALDTVATIAGLVGSPAQFAAAIAELEASELILKGKGEGENGETLTTRHGIVSEIAIARLPPAARRALYGRAARTLAEEGRSPPAVVAVQHDIAGDRSRAFEAALNAATSSRDLHATREQEFFLKLALSNAPDREAQGKVRIDLAELYRRLGRPAEVLEVLAATVMADAPMPLQHQARAMRLLTHLSRLDPQLTTDSALFEIRNLEQHIDPHLAASLYFQLAAAAHDLGHTAHTLAAAERSLTISRQLPPGPKSALLASRSAMVIGLYTHAEDGLKVIDQLIPAVEANPEALAQCVLARATLLVAAGRLLEAETQFLYGIELVERCYLYANLCVLHNNLGVCYTEQGKYREAQRQLEEAARVGQELIGSSNAATDNLCLLHWERGEFEVAMSHLQVHPAVDVTGSTRSLILRHALKGLCALEFGLLAKGFEVKREIELLLMKREYWSSDVSYVEAFLARMLVLEGNPEAARARLETALEVYRGRDMMCRSRLELELARLDLKADPRAALERAENMIELLRGTGARPLIERFEELVDRARVRSG
jgi:tetratricopeptide (TPR) repeat protein